HRIFTEADWRLLDFKGRKAAIDLVNQDRRSTRSAARHASLGQRLGRGDCTMATISERHD
ncbi:hypothetical protein, partial [Mesorhizobium sp. M1A.F.Ca.ET.072.01.1.1]|uniref:hypothetical protein n=1 Tax=Mesorhizobium sp. M1A.F.Ca.ET.072.01.1.1 TaxID=2496753 RepID=UPI001AECCB30